MPTKSTNRTSKKPTKSKASAVRVGGKSSTPAWHSRWQTFIFALVFAVVGGILLVLTHATTSPNCSSYTATSASAGSNMQLCVSLSSANNLSATATYVGHVNQDTLSSGSVSLMQCDGSAKNCVSVATSSRIIKPNPFVPKNAYLTTPAQAFAVGKVYQGCVTFATRSGWQLNNVCTNLLTYGNGYPASPQIYAPQVGQPPQNQSPPPSPSPNNDCGGTTITKSDGTTWKCTFDDEFSGNAVDTTKWAVTETAHGGYHSGQECFVNNPNNVLVSGGYLNLTVRQEAQQFTCEPNSPKAYTTQYTSGMIWSYQKFSQTYGRFEVRAKVPNVDVKGLQESFWMWPVNPFDEDPDNLPWPVTGEIDISEIYSVASSIGNPTLHYYPSDLSQKVTGSCNINKGQFNTYTVEWTSQVISFYFNGNLCFSNNWNPHTSQTKPDPFGKPYFINLTQALGIDTKNIHNGFDSSITPLPDTTQVDYVRVWQ